ncbi:hypothetical protein DCC81_07495 [Chitinophaga parva]|uniref:PKD domain-containing protein n=2 Tax=Chitinophaga parva TaxID=2169414 RepID=A0A2T7BNP5_9BACT|nr:hypothetical protein DCC81_07495 [Chitinophaga parva]
MPILMKTRQLQRMASRLLLFLCGLASLPAAAQTVSFTLDNDHGCGSLAVNATNTSTAGATAWDWYFGEGTGHSSLPNASHVYTKPGTYTVTLTATYGGTKKTATQTVTVYNLPTAAFTPSVTEGCSPLTVHFTNQSTAGDGTIASAAWDYGDKFGEDQNANTSHTYTIDPTVPANHPDGVTYPVSLVITNSFGCKSAPFTGNASIHVDVAPLITITSDITGACSVPQTVHFSNAAQADPGETYLWDYGDGTKDNTGTHTYTQQGDFKVVCTATSAKGCTTVSEPATFSIHPIKADFTVSNTCAGRMVTFTNNSSPATGGAQWDFGDGTTGYGNQVQHQFNTAGTYNITMTAVGTVGCSSSPITKAVNISSMATISNVPTRIGSCAAPYTATFTANTSGAVRWDWVFGDGTTGSGQTVTHTFKNQGTFLVSVSATNADGCYVTKVVDTVALEQPVAQLDMLSGCLPLAATFAPTITSKDPVTSLDWDFGDGTTGTGNPATHTYTKQGDFDIKLTMHTAGGCVKDTVFKGAVQTGTPLTVDFSADPLVACAKTPIAFKNLTTPVPLNDSIVWLWQFGNDGASTEQTPSHSFLIPGKQTITLTATNNGCVTRAQKVDYLTIRTPVAIFTLKQDCDHPYVAAVTNTSRVDPAGSPSYAWDFGDGSPVVTDKDPAPHTYAKTGRDTIRLTVADGGCQTDTMLVKTVMDPHPLLTSDKDTVCMNNDITYHLSNFTPEEIASGTWDINPASPYGNGTNDFSMHYTQPANFTATFRYTDGVGCARVTNQIPIAINGAVARVAVTSTANCVGKEITFSDKSIAVPSDPITSWRFDWGDDSPSTGKLTTRPVDYGHTFAGDNLSFNVTYSVTDSAGCGPYGVTLPVNLNQPKADFTLGSPYGCPGAPISLANASKDIGNNPQPFSQVNWTFSDGTTATGETPYKAFSAAGTYDITLNVMDAIGCTASITKTQAVTVHDPKAVFSLPDISNTCPPVLAKFENNSTDTKSSSWDFGDGGTSDLATPTHIYNRPGTYDIVLTVTSLGECTAQATETVKVKGPDGTLSMSSKLGCPPLALTARVNDATNTVRYTYDFDDGTTNVVTASSEPHTYTQPGVYHPRLLLEDADGCKVPAMGDNEVVVDSIGTNLVVDATLACNGGPVTFIANSASVAQQVLGLPNEVTWDFGTTGPDNTASGDTATHNYSVGKYTATMRVTSPGGCVAPPVTYDVDVKAKAQPVIDVIPTLCIGNTYQPVGHDQANLANAKWTWQIKGSTYTTQQPPSILFDNAGTFPVKLKVENSDGSCPDSTTANVIVNPPPAVTVTPREAGVCEGSSTTLTAMVAPGNTVTWTDYHTSNINALSTQVSPDIDTLYRVQVQDAAGCINYDSARVSVVRKFTLDAIPAVAVCEGQSTQLLASGADLYSWSPATGLNSASIPNPMATPATSTVYTVTAKDKTGCFTETADVNVTVNPAPVLKVVKDQTVMAGESVPVQVQGSSDITTVSWYPTDGLSCTDCLTPTITPTHSGAYNITATNQYGCTTIEQVNFKVVCNGAAFVPNTFTPNGDGMNDIFYIRGRGVKVVTTFRIYNRWGQVMFQRDNFPIEDIAYGWDGRVGGQPAPPDAFVYYAELICETGEHFTLKGSIMLLR